MVVLDVSIVNVALPSIKHDLHYSNTGLQWVVNAYVLTFAGFLLLGGRAADLYGRRRVFMSGLALFSVASLLGGFATNSAELTAARAVQGLGGAVLSPATLTLIITTFSGARLAKALGMWGAVAGAGGAVGSILGGVLTATLSWRWVLFVNVPIGIAAFVVAGMFLAERRGQDSSVRLDVAGAVTVTAGLAVLIYAIVGTDQYAWTSAHTLVPLAIAAVLLGVFAFIELRLASHPLVPFRLFRSRSLSGANVVMFLVGCAFFAFWYFLSLYMQGVLGYSALRAGMAFLPMAIAVIIGAQFASRLMTKLGVRALLLVGTALAAGGFLWLSHIQADSTYWSAVFGPSCIIAFSLGCLFTPLAAAATYGVSPTEAGLASGVLNTSRQVGGSLGLAVLATIATDHFTSLVRGGTAPHVALTAGYARAFTVASVIGVVAFAVSWVVPAIGRVRATPDEAARAEQASGSGAPAAQRATDPAAEPA
jgi:EmrB/QacA subfamily drug resistance transporter